MALSKLNVRKTTDLMAELIRGHAAHAVTTGHLVESLTEVLRLPLSRLIRWYWDSSMSPSVAGVSVHLCRDTDGSSRQGPSTCTPSPRRCAQSWPPAGDRTASREGTAGIEI